MVNTDRELQGRVTRWQHQVFATASPLSSAYFHGKLTQPILSRAQLVFVGISPSYELSSVTSSLRPSEVEATTVLTSNFFSSYRLLLSFTTTFSCRYPHNTTATALFTDQSQAHLQQAFQSRHPIGFDLHCDILFVAHAPFRGTLEFRSL